MLKGMKIQNGVLFLQAFVENGEVRVYEPGFRLNGAQEHILVSYVTGIDAKELMINHAMSGKISDKNIADMADPEFNGKWACKLSPLVKEGKIARIDGLEEIKKIPGVISINPSYEEGNVVEGKGTLRQIVCRFYVVCDTKLQLKETLDKITNLLHVYNDEGEDMMLTPFDTDLILTRY